MRKVKDYILIMITLVSLGTNVYLVRRLSLDRHHNRPIQLNRVGEEMAAIETVGTAPIELLNQSKPTLLYVFHPLCHFCAMNHESVNTLAHAVSQNINVIGLALQQQGLGEYLKRHPMSFPIYVVSQKFAIQWKLVGTPETIFVGIDGKVRNSWPGAYVGSTRSELERDFEVSLPDITPNKPLP